MVSVILPDAPWRHRPGLDQLTAILGAHEGEARFVGGVVRDTLLGLPVADIDIATRLDPQQVLERLREASIRAVPTGLAHGTVTAVLPDGPVEVTTLRRDVATDGRHATVAFTDDWREDAARRDFTMNALYADPQTGEVFDYFDGRVDLAAGRVRFIGNPLQRIAEDHLRILRFFRFHARFGDTIDAAGLDACTQRANDLMALSRERIAGELLRLLVAQHAVTVIGIMIARGIFAPVLPDITDERRLAALAAAEAAQGIAPDPVRRLAALLPADAAIADLVGARLKLSTADRKRLISATQPIEAASPFELSYRIGRIHAVDRLLLSGRDASAVANWTAPGLPITGGALVDRGIGKGPDVARLLRTIEDRWIGESFPDAARVAGIADDVVAQFLRADR